MADDDDDDDAAAIAAGPTAREDLTSDAARWLSEAAAIMKACSAASASACLLSGEPTFRLLGLETLEITCVTSILSTSCCIAALR